MRLRRGGFARPCGRRTIMRARLITLLKQFKAVSGQRIFHRRVYCAPDYISRPAPRPGLGGTSRLLYYKRRIKNKKEKACDLIRTPELKTADFLRESRLFWERRAEYEIFCE